MARPAQFIEVFVILVALAYSCEANRCSGGPNDVWVECGSTCHSICGRPKPANCNFMCYRGCTCKPNYYRRADGQCVTLRGCRHSKNFG